MSILFIIAGIIVFSLVVTLFILAAAKMRRDSDEDRRSGHRSYDDERGRR